MAFVSPNFDFCTFQRLKLLYRRRASLRQDVWVLKTKHSGQGGSQWNLYLDSPCFCKDFPRR